MGTILLAVSILIAVPAFAQTQPDLLAQRQMCDAQAEKVFHKTMSDSRDFDREHTTRTAASYTDHYDQKDSICYVAISGGRDSGPDDGLLETFHIVLDAFEHTTVASYQSDINTRTKISVQSCEVNDEKCAHPTPPEWTWMADHRYATGDHCLDPDANIRIVTTAGTSGSMPPDWNISTTILTTQDNTVQWTLVSSVDGLEKAFKQSVKQKFGVDIQ